jgi:hypothetical protein
MTIDNREMYQDVIKEFGAKRISSRMKALLEQIVAIVNWSNVSDKVCINGNLLKYAVLDYFCDMYKLKHFHTTIDNAQVSKIYGYEAYWLIRRKPIQIIVPIDDDNMESLLHINERIISFNFICKVLIEKEVDIESLTSGQLAALVNLYSSVFYYLRYIILTPQTMELLVESFFAGYELK